MIVGFELRPNKMIQNQPQDVYTRVENIVIILFFLNKDTF